MSTTGGSPPQSPTTQEAALLAELDVLNRQLETVRLSDTLSTRSGSDKHVAKRRFAYVSNDEGGVRQGSEELYKGDVGGFCQLPERRAGIDARAIEAFADAVKATVGKDEKKLEAGKASGRRLVAEGKTGHNLNAGEGKRRDVEKGRTERILSGVGGEKGRRLVVEKEVGTHVEGKEQRIDRGLDAGGNLSVAEGTANDRILSSTSLNGAESNQTTALRDRGFSVSSGPRRRLSASEPPKTPNSHPAKTPDSRAASRRRSESDGVSEAALLRTDEPFPEGRLRRYSDGRTAGCGSASESLRTVKAHRSSEAFHGSAVAKAAGQPRRRSAHGATREERSLGAEQRHSGRGLDREAACRGAERVQKRTGRGARVSPGSALVGETTETESQPVATGSGSPLKAAKLAAHPNTGGAFFQLLEKSRDGHQLQREERGDEERAGSMDGVPSAVASGANGAPEPDQPLCVFVRLSQLAGRRRARSVSDGRHVAAPELRTTAERQRAVSHSGERRVALEESIAEVGENEVQGRGSANCSFAVEWPRDMGDCSGEAARASCDGPVVATGERKRVKEASPERRRAMEPGSGKASDDALRIHHEAEIRIAEETSVDIPEDAWGQFVGAGEAVNTDIMSAEKEPEKSENSTGWSWGHADEEMFLCAERARLRKVKTRLETGSDSAGESRESAPQGGRARRGGISGFWMRVEVDDVKEGMPTQDGGQATDLGLVEKTAESSGSVSNGNGSRNGASVAKLVARFELLWADPSVRDDVSSDVKLAGCTEENEAEAGLSGAEPVWVQWERELLETSSREQTPRGNELEKRGRIPS